MMQSLKFHELSKKQKLVAAEEVFNKETLSGDEWSLESERITQDIETIIDDYKLKHDGIPWEDHYGIDVDLRSVETTREFYDTFLTKEQLELIDDLGNVSCFSLEHTTFDGEDDFVLEGEYSDIEWEDAIEFLEKYGSEDDKDQFAFVTLLEGELNEAQIQKLDNVVIPLAETLTQEVSEFISVKLGEVRETIYETIREALDYFGSVEYYHNILAEGVEEKYKFDENGKVIEIKEVNE